MAAGTLIKGQKMKLLAFMAIFTLPACDTYELEQQRMATYCEMLSIGAWQDYDKTIDCEEVQ